MGRPTAHTAHRHRPLGSGRSWALPRLPRPGSPGLDTAAFRTRALPSLLLPSERSRISLATVRTVSPDFAPQTHAPRKSYHRHGPNGLLCDRRRRLATAKPVRPSWPERPILYNVPPTRDREACPTVLA
ncbi:hypothetical protein PUN28_000539 [Cardiocondyla obscurior]|uniref:Uncharacterized protein n=1 Tax=Cardiocondyla obscurior TaxID=286306 RepID=A0AAW2H046_9HYME